MASASGGDAHGVADGAPLERRRRGRTAREGRIGDGDDAVLHQRDAFGHAVHDGAQLVALRCAARPCAPRAGCAGFRASEPGRRARRRRARRQRPRRSRRGSSRARRAVIARIGRVSQRAERRCRGAAPASERHQARRARSRRARARRSGRDGVERERERAGPASAARRERGPAPRRRAGAGSPSSIAARPRRRRRRRRRWTSGRAAWFSMAASALAGTSVSPEHAPVALDDRDALADRRRLPGSPAQAATSVWMRAARARQRACALRARASRAATSRTLSPDPGVEHGGGRDQHRDHHAEKGDRTAAAGCADRHLQRGNAATAPRCNGAGTESRNCHNRVG